LSSLGGVAGGDGRKLSNGCVERGKAQAAQARE